MDTMAKHAAFPPDAPDVAHAKANLLFHGLEKGAYTVLVLMGILSGVADHDWATSTAPPRVGVRDSEEGLW